MTREEKLKSEFNNFLSSKLSLTNDDYYSKLDTEGFMELKTFLSDINNIITLKLTLEFVEMLESIFEFSKDEKAKIIEKIQATSPNANGFDIEMSKPIKLVAEVKGNIPIKNGAEFGYEQKKGILRDLRSLKNGKKKSAICTDDFYKFMVMPDTEMTRNAMDKLLGSLKNTVEYKDYKFEIISGKAEIHKTDVIYIVFVDII